MQFNSIQLFSHENGNSLFCPPKRFKGICYMYKLCRILQFWPNDAVQFNKTFLMKIETNCFILWIHAFGIYMLCEWLNYFLDVANYLLITDQISFYVQHFILVWDYLLYIIYLLPWKRGEWIGRGRGVRETVIVHV